MIGLRLALAILAAVLFAASPAAAAIDPVLVRVSVDRQTLTMGESILLSLQVDAERGFQVVDPGVTRTLGAFEVVETLNAQQSALTGGATRLLFRYRITAFVVGDLALPPINVRVKDAAGAESTVSTAELPIAVLTVIGPGEDPTRLQPLRPQLDVPGGLPYQIARGVTTAAAGIVVIGVAAAALRARRRSAVRRAAPPVLTGTSAERTLADLTGLAQERLPDEGRFDEHYDRLSHAIRSYLAGRYGIAAGQRTASELRREMERSGVDRTQASFLFDLLHEGEVVRFRRVPPSPRHANDVVRSAVEFLRKAALSEQYDLAGGRSR